MKIIRIVFFIAALAASAGCSGTESIRIAENGKSCFSIVCPDNASPAVRFAADELEKYLKAITGADFSIVPDNNGPSIIVCEAADVQAACGSHLDVALEGESFGQFLSGDDIILTGGRGRAVLYSVYDFLEKAGCVWAAPAYYFYEGRHEFVPEDPCLLVDLQKADVNSTMSPYRKLYITGQREEADMMALVDWMPKVRYNTAAFKMVGPSQWNLWRERMIPEYEKRDMVIEDGGHGYDFFIGPDMEDGRLFQEHPEWFGMNKKLGKKELGYRSDRQRVIFCTSNDDAVAYMHRNLEKYITEHPELDIFDFWPPDQELWCECDECKAIGTESDQHARLVNLTADFLREKFPDLELECLAYHHYYEPPVNGTIPDDMLVDFADYYQNFEYQFYDHRNEANRKHDEALRKWAAERKGDMSIYSYYCKGFWRSLPNVIPHYIQNDMKYYRSLGVKGVSVYSEPKNWFTFGLNLYSLAKTAWDPETDIEKVVDSYCRTVFGDDSDIARHAFDEFEDIVRFSCVIHQTTFRNDEDYDAWRSRLESLGEKIAERMNRVDKNTVRYRHLERLYLMDSYAIRSTEMMRRLAAEDRAKERKPFTENLVFDQLPGVVTSRPPLDEDLKQWLVAHRGLGVFAE